MKASAIAPGATGPKQTGGQGSSQSRFYALDGLRGIAAMIIVVLHYRNLNDHWNENIINTNPYWYQFAAVWKFGWLGVEFFFTLSGFIFFWKYGQMVSDKAITLTNFAVLRLSRLYPLHLAALFTMGVAQYFYYLATKTTWIYVNNDIYHLILQLTFLNYGWISEGHSWNAAAWTIALEMALYFIFYAVCFGRQNRTLISLTLFLISVQFLVKGPVPNVPFLNEPFLRASTSFFLGGTLLFLYEKMRINARIAAILSTAMLGFVILLLVLTNLISLGNLGLLTLTGQRLNMVWVLGGFPCLMLSCLLGRHLGRLFGSKPFTYLGDISYSVYMIHMPIQVFIALFSLKVWHLNFLSKWIFWGYIGIVVMVATISHYYFEKPVMRYLRRRLLVKPKATETQQAAQSAA